MESGDDFRFTLGDIEGRTIGLGDARYEVHQHQRKQPGPVPAEQAALRVDDVADVEAARCHQHADHGESHGDLIGDDLRGRTHGAQEGVLGVRRPAGENDAVHAHGGERQNVDSPASILAKACCGEKGMTAHIASEGTKARNGAKRNRNPFESAGMMISLKMSLTTSANGCARPGINRPGTDSDPFDPESSR